MTEQLKDVNDWWPSPKGFRKNVRESAFDTGFLYKGRGGKWRLGSNAVGAQIAHKERCCFIVEGNTGGICGAEASGKLVIKTGIISPIDGKPEQKLLPLCDEHKDIIQKTQ